MCVFCVAGKVSVISRNVHLYKFYSTFLKTEHDEYTLYSHVFTFRCVFHVNTYSFSIFPCISKLGTVRKGLFAVRAGSRVMLCEV